jgi:hypothetical protein
MKSGKRPDEQKKHKVRVPWHVAFLMHREQDSLHSGSGSFKKIFVEKIMIRSRLAIIKLS